ncbi:MAG: dihydrofolate reductase family protein [Saprospiraceae bacterium]
MRSLVLFVATSLDGFIATENGNTDWLFDDQDYGFMPFYFSVDTLLMGYTTYINLIEEGEPYPYPSKNAFIFTKRHQKLDDNPVTFTSKDPVKFLQKLKAAPGADIWLVGGCSLNSLFLSEGLIDKIIMSVHPVFLGKGIPIFNEEIPISAFELESSKNYNSGLVQVVLRKMIG